MTRCFWSPYVQRLAALWKECAPRVRAAGGGASPDPAPGGWRPAGSTGGSEILCVPRHHMSILKEPSVQVLAKNMQSAVDNSD